MRYVSQLFLHHFQQTRSWSSGYLVHAYRNLLATLLKVKRIGLTQQMSAHEKNKLAIFNYLNFFQLTTGILVPVIGFFYTGKVYQAAWMMAILPAFISISVLVLNAYRLYSHALLTYFILYPFVTCLVYINGISLGVELFFILYGILSVFFIRERTYMVFSIGFSMISYFVLSVMLKKYPFQLEDVSNIIYLINQALAIIYIFYGLYLIKTENSNFNTTLQQSNAEIQKQSMLLQQQAEQLNQLNSLKNKLFSVISHDLKAPMYALRNLFDSIQTQDMPGGEIKALVPDIKKDLNYTVGLMENLLQWAKSQMQAESARPQVVHLRDAVDEVMQLLHLQAEVKRIRMANNVDEQAKAWADNDMITLVLRNLVSNAIKFTPPGGTITIGANPISSYTEVYVQDSGKGMTQEELERIDAGDFYSTNGTSQEQGTGLGLLLCKEFLARNDSRLRIETMPEKGSIFSFTLPRSN